MSVNQSEWARILSDAGYRDTVLLEVPVLSPAEDEQLALAAARLQEARDFYLEGRYAKAVEGCRHVLESLGHQLEDGHGRKADLVAALKDHEKLTKEERLMAIRWALFSMTCLAAHSKDEVSIRTGWDRHEALSMLTMTAAIVQWLSDDVAD